MNTKIKIVLIIALVLVVAVVFFVTQRVNNDRQLQTQIPDEEPLDVVLEFYNNWLRLVSDNSVDEYQSELFTSSVLSNQVRSRALAARAESPEADPITCQTDVTPERFRARIFPASATESKILVESRVGDTILPFMSFVTLTAVGGKWQITEIDCTAGDIAPEVEFNYDREGLLLKSVPPPFEAGQWHLVFEQDGQMGHVTPLIFSATTTCVSASGVENLCNPDTFTETARVIVKGGLTEVGAEVVRVEFFQ